MIDTGRLEKLGMKGAAQKINEMRELRTKLEIAYKNFRVLTPDKIEAFNEKLKKETMQEDRNSYSYKTLSFTALEDYDAIPPEEVLQKIERAIEKNCFDSFEVCKIAWHKEIKDPIVFGVIKNCTDKFFVGQWDSDIKIDDIIYGDTENAKK